MSGRYFRRLRLSFRHMLPNMVHTAVQMLSCFFCREQLLFLETFTQKLLLSWLLFCLNAYASHNLSARASPRTHRGSLQCSLPSSWMVPLVGPGKDRLRGEWESAAIGEFERKGREGTGERRVRGKRWEPSYFSKCSDASDHNSYSASDRQSR